MKELEDDVEDGGRGMAEWAAGADVAVLANLVGRAGEGLLLEGVENLVLVGVLGGVALTALDRLALSAALCGSGLMGRETFSAGERTVSPFIRSRRSSFSLSELLSGLRVPVRGEGGFAVSSKADFGRYFGRAEDDVLGLRGRTEADLVTPTLSKGFEGCSSMDDRWTPADTRRRVIVLDSGVAARRIAWGVGLASPIEARGAAGLMPIALRRRELVSFPFLEPLSTSLLITSANAFPARPRECLMELLVEGLVRGLPLELVSDGLFMVLKQAGYRIRKRRDVEIR